MSNFQYSHDPLGYYQIMDLSHSASDAEIKQSYRDKAKLWHPDHNSGAEATEKFQKLAVAYDVLKTAKTRLFYDLLAQAYHNGNFPDMDALKCYRDRAGVENPYLRTFSLQRVVGKIFTYSSQRSDEICSSAEAGAVIFRTSLSNWLLGWWNIPALFKNISALKNNYRRINHNRQENLTMLIHNAVAYYQENKPEKSMLSALQACEYANNYQRELLGQFIRLLGLNPPQFLPRWNYLKLRLIQLIIPGILLSAILLSFSVKVVTEQELWNIFANQKEITYYQEVRFADGGETFDDQVVSRVIKIPVDVTDTSLLYHFKRSAKVMYGPAENFDVVAKVPGQTTVRITGKSPDGIWYRVMLDSGAMGFSRQEELKSGIGLEIPANSKIYTPL